MTTGQQDKCRFFNLVLKLASSFLCISVWLFVLDNKMTFNQRIRCTRKRCKEGLQNLIAEQRACKDIKYKCAIRSNSLFLLFEEDSVYGFTFLSVCQCLPSANFQLQSFGLMVKT